LLNSSYKTGADLACLISNIDLLDEQLGVGRMGLDLGDLSNANIKLRNILDLLNWSCSLSTAFLTLLLCLLTLLLLLLLLLLLTAIFLLLLRLLLLFLFTLRLGLTLLFLGSSFLLLLALLSFLLLLDLGKLRL